MELQKNAKCVIIVAEGLPLGPTANITSVLATTLGARVKSLIGPDVSDASGAIHPGFTTLPLPILMASLDAIKQLRQQTASMPDLFVADFTETAQHSRTYTDYIEELSAHATGDLTYLGLLLYGPKKMINSLAGNFRLLRETGPTPIAYAE